MLQLFTHGPIVPARSSATSGSIRMRPTDQSWDATRHALARPSPAPDRCPVRAGRSLDLTTRSRVDALALILTAAAMIMFLFAASGRELRRFNEIAVGLVFSPRQ